MPSVDYFRGLAVVLMLLYDFVLFFSSTLPRVLQHSRPDMLLFGDFIAPFFLFIMGLALPLSVNNKRESGVSERQIFWGVLRRAILLLLIGVLVDDLRSPLLGGTIGLGGTYYIKWGVLEALGVSYLVSYIIMRFGARTRYAIIAAILAAYVGLMTNSSFAAFVQSHSHGSPLSALTWASIAAFGMIAGVRLVNSRVDYEKYLYRFGATLVMIGTVLSLFVPARKEMVTSSYALITAGGSAIAFMFMYYFIETRALPRVIKWLRPLSDFGRAALLAWILQYAVPGYLIWRFHTYGKLDAWLGIPLSVLMIVVVWLLIRGADRIGFRLAV